MNAALHESLIEQTEAHYIRNWAISASDLEFLRRQMFMQVEISNAEQLSVYLGSLLTRSDSDLLVAVGVAVDLDQLSH